ncbi:hypothetical protein [Streptomyces olindensis]|uniref:hypothetical protein n=1 Tax=Streptomyces olindensis TaxID=358823 RepID=UPI0033EEDBCB
MRHAIAWIFEALLRLLLPARGRHRAPEPSRAVRPSEAPLVRLPRVPALRGEDIGLVRPYLVAHERREAERRQRTPRRTLVLAPGGIGIRPRRTRGMGVAA